MINKHKLILFMLFNFLIYTLCSDKYYEESHLIKEAFILADSFEKIGIPSEKDNFISECKEYIERFNYILCCLWYENNDIVYKAFMYVSQMNSFREMLSQFINVFIHSFYQSVGYTKNLNQYGIEIRKALENVILNWNNKENKKIYQMLNELEIKNNQQMI